MTILSIFLLISMFAPLPLTVWNIYTFIRLLRRGVDKRSARIIEPVAIAIGVIDVFGYASLKYEATSNDWYEQLYNRETHFFLSGESLPTLYILLAVAAAGYMLIRYVSAEKLPPLLAAFGIAGLYIGMALCILLFIQLKTDGMVLLFSANCILVFIKTVCIFVKRRNALLQSGEQSTRFKRLSIFVNSCVGLPALGFVALVPLLGIILAIMTLFGQEPSDIIKLWTETADWTFSQKIPPQNIYQDQHYLCTVAAGGHRKTVKPLRTGVRHGHRVVVNRQLCIANAFEEVIMQRAPRFHKAVRTVYDSTGYPIAKHIKSKYVADAIYYLMKPLEWLFLAVLYATCARPEDRIAVQYPHAKVPKLKG